ncbi:hypothetical protein DVH05_011605 [Phytophthora capsici]|nr:hypothetical protein DVH05_011605 [Phytophthora capsici]
MSADEMHPTPLSDKNGVVERSEADEDARTESSEGSNAQSQWTPDADESEDEFEDAMEPPSSTTGMLFTFDGAVAPLSGVYEDAVEATEEQVWAVIVSDRRQSTIQEKEEDDQEEEKENDVEGEVVAVVDGIVERVAAVEYEGGEKVEELADIQAETVVERVLIGEEDTVQEDVAEGDVVIGAQAVEDAEVEETPETLEVEFAEADIDNEVLAAVEERKEEAAEIVSDPDTPRDCVVLTSDSVESIVTDPLCDTDPVTEQPIMDNEAPKDATAQIIDQEATREATRSGAIEVMILVENTANETVGVNSVEDDTVFTQEEDGNPSIEQEPTDPLEADATLLVDKNDAGVPCERSTVEEPLTTHSPEGATTEVEEVVAQVTDELVEAVLLEHDKTDHTDDEDLEETPSLDLVVKEVVTGETSPGSGSEAHAITLQEGSQDRNVPAKDEQNTVQEEVIAPASAVKEVTDSYRKSSYDHPNSGVLLGLLPRLEPTSGATTTTTIEPFVLSSESNEMMHLPPQRWTYEVYGFSIEDRVVYYHIHRSDRRTGIREPPILKRYTDFRELQTQLLDTRLHAATDMPRVPKPHLGTVFRGYKSKKTIEIREKAFRALLQYISQYPALHGSSIFERFITTTRASAGAGWM